MHGGTYYFSGYIITSRKEGQFFQDRDTTDQAIPTAKPKSLE